MAKKDKYTQKLLNAIKETPEQRRRRVQAEGGCLHSRKVKMKGQRYHERKELRNKAALRPAQYN